MNARGFKDEDWNDQECDIDNAPIRQYFDEIPREGKTPWGKSGKKVPWATMLIGDEITVMKHHERYIKNYGRLTGKEFVFQPAHDGMLHVYRDA